MNAETRHSEGGSSRRRHPILTHLEHKLAAGLLVVVPLGVTLFILRFLFRLADGLFAPYISRLGTLFHRGYIPGLGIVAGILLIYLSGLLAANFIGHRLIAQWDRTVSRTPFVKSIYLAAKQLVDVFHRKKEGAGFRQAAYIEFPLEGIFALAFISNETVSASGKRYYSCFVPTAPNPTSGFVLILGEDQVYPAGISIEEAMKIIVSGGFVAPGVLLPAKLQ